MNDTATLPIAPETVSGSSCGRVARVAETAGPTKNGWLHTLFPWVAAALIALYGLELGLHAVRASVTYDEPVFMLTGYHDWKCDDHGYDPENPPLLGLVAALPLQFKSIKQPVPLCAPTFTTKFDEYVEGMQFLVDNKVDPIVIPARFAAMSFTLLMVVLLVVATKRLFGESESLLALALLVFEPNMIAHGSLATTDMAAATTFFASVFALYLYVERPSIAKAGFLGLAIGGMLSTKHSGLPAVIFLWVLMASIAWFDSRNSREAQGGLVKRLRGGAYGLIGAMLIGYACLWASYGFRFYAMPNLHRQSLPPTALDPGTGGAPGFISTLTNWGRSIGILPEAYLFGITDVLRQNIQHPAFLLGRMHPHGLWYYFPVAFTVKTSLTLLIMLAAGIFGLVRYREHPRACLFLAIPAICYFAFVLTSGLDIGIRHILPVYPFLIVLASAGVCQCAKRAPRMWIAAIALLAFAAADSARTFPDYIAFSNELWGGTNNTYKILSDSNTDWGQNLKQLQTYIARNHVGECWIAAPGTPDIALAALPCHLLPARYQWVVHPLEDIPSTISGTIFLSDEDFPAQYPGVFDSLVATKPVAEIGGTTFAYQGTFDIRQAAIVAHTDNSTFYYKRGRLAEATSEMRAVSALEPYDPRPHCVVGIYMLAASDAAAARTEFGACLQLAGSDPDNSALRELARSQLNQLH